MAGSGITFHEKKANYSDCYKAWAEITLPSNSVMLPSGTPTFVAYALFGCHHSSAGNFDAGIQVCGNGKYKLCFNGGTMGALEAPWVESKTTFSARGKGTMTVELVYLTATTGKVVLSAFGQTLECNFASGKWSSFKNGVKFWKEMTVATGANPITTLWSSYSTKIKTVYMSDFTFGTVKFLRHATGTSTEFVLDNDCEVSSTPRIDGGDTGRVLPSWEQLRYGGLPTTGVTDTLSIDCR